MANPDNGNPVVNPEDEIKLNQQRCVVYEFTNFDEPRIRRINKHCVWNSDGMSVHIEPEFVVARSDRETSWSWEAISDWLQRKPTSWFIPFDTVTGGVGVAAYINFCLPHGGDNPEWIRWSTERVPGKRMILVVSREYRGRLYVDGNELVREDPDSLDLKLVRELVA